MPACAAILEAEAQVAPASSAVLDASWSGLHRDAARCTVRLQGYEQIPGEAADGGHGEQGQVTGRTGAQVSWQRVCAF